METPRHESLAALRQEIADLEHRWIQALRAGDASTLRRLLSDHTMVVSVDGTVGSGREAAARILLALSMQALDVLQTEVQVLGSEAVVVTGRALLQLSGDGQDHPFPIRFTRVWQQRSDRWKIIAAHTSRASS